MGEQTKIGWTDHTLNFWTGCTKVSVECDNCYIPRTLRRSPDQLFRGPRRTQNWKEPALWNAKAAEAGVRRRVFTCSVSDFFHKDADAWREEAWDIIRECTSLDWLILTKRAKRIRENLPEDWGDGYTNVWLGVTVGCETSMSRLRWLRDVPAHVKFISAEPLLERLDFRPFLKDIDWVITGCERAGVRKRREMNIDWIRDIEHQCQFFNVPHFFKQSYSGEGGCISEQPLLDGKMIQNYPSPVLPTERQPVRASIGSESSCSNGSERRPSSENSAETEVAESGDKSTNGSLEVIPAEILGLRRDATVRRIPRRSNFIKKEQGSTNPPTVCKSSMWDLMIGAGPCDYRCRGCCLKGTFRELHEFHHKLYSNVEDFWKAVERWLTSSKRQPRDTLGLGMHHSDSLLYEGVTGHARHIIPMFADPKSNPKGTDLILLTKSANVDYLKGLPTAHTVVSFSLNPEPIADLWEGKYADTGERITPPIPERLQACLAAQNMGFEVRWRLDPILNPPGWYEHYQEFFQEAAGLELKPTFITLGMFRDATNSLETWNEKRGDPPMKGRPENMKKDGSHYRAPREERIDVYSKVLRLCKEHFPDAEVGLCKEVIEVREALGLSCAACNCSFKKATPPLSQLQLPPADAQAVPEQGSAHSPVPPSPTVSP